MKKTTLGGERLGTEGKMEVGLKGYDRSNHDLSYAWRSSMAPGTVVPFMKKVALPGDTWDIDLEMIAMTHPTIGPLFGSYKLEADIFMVPMRLYIADLHNNSLKVGLNMSQIQIPTTTILTYGEITDGLQNNKPQINGSCIWHYLGVKGLGQATVTGTLHRVVNAIPLLAYWDIYKQYYSNKQEENAFVIHHAPPIQYASVAVQTSTALEAIPNGKNNPGIPGAQITDTLNIDFSFPVGTTITQQLINQVAGTTLWMADEDGNGYYAQNISQLFLTVVQVDVLKIRATTINNPYVADNFPDFVARGWELSPLEQAIELYPFPLTNIDTMRYKILQQAGIPGAYSIDAANLAPYNLLNGVVDPGVSQVYATTLNQEGLGVKTYISDLLNNWVETTSYDAIATQTSVATTGGGFSIDSLRFANKLNQLLQRVATSGGTYMDWLESVYDKNPVGLPEAPVYMGSLIQEIVFSTVVSMAATETSQGSQPIGTLAGRGANKANHKGEVDKKGGKIIIHVDEPSYIMGMVHITPRVDYSQGNDWDIDLQSINDLHKPQLDEIGFQHLITEEMAWFGSSINNAVPGVVTKYSAGYQPAWVNYMTSINECHGNFAEIDNEMFMTLNRRYKQNTFDTINGIADVTTYIDPSKFNYIFAETDLNSQNFWIQIGINAHVRRVMSAKIMPNL